MKIQELADIVIGVGQKVDTLEVSFGELSHAVVGLGTQVNNLEVRFDGLEEKFDDRIDELAAMTARGFTEVNQRIDGIDNRLEIVEGTVLVMDRKLDDTRSDLKSLIFDNTRITGRIENLEVHSFGSVQAA